MARDGEVIQRQHFCHHGDTVCHPKSGYLTTKHHETSTCGCNNNAMFSGRAIGLYRDVWIASIASSGTRLATLTGAMCKTSRCELRSLRVHSGMLNVIRIVTYCT